MFKSILRLTKQSAIYGLGHVLSKAIVILLLPLHTNFVTPLEYGVATQLLVFLGIMGIIYSYGLNTALLQFFILEKDPNQRKKYFSTAFLSTLITSVLLSIALFSIKFYITRLLFDTEQFAFLINLSIGILIFDALILLAKNILRAEERAVSYVIFSVLNVLINYSLNYILVVRLSLGVRGIYWANLLASGLTLMLFLPLVKNYFTPTVSRELLIRMLKFGLPFLPSTLAIFVIDSIDRMFITRYLGLEATGIYGAGYKLALVIKLFTNAFQFAWIPFFISMAKQEKAKEVFARILTYFTLACSLVFLLFCMYMDQIIRVRIFGYPVMGKEYWAGAQIVPVVILAYICYGWHLNFLVGVFLKEKTHYLAYITGLSAIINILGNVWLIPRFRLMGAAYATLLSYFSMMVLLYLPSQHLYPISYEWRKILTISLLTGLVYLLFRYLPFPHEEVMKVCLIAIFFLVLYYSGFFETQEIKKLESLVKGLLK